MSSALRWQSSTKQIAAFGYHDVTDAPGDSGFQRNGALAYKLGTRTFSRQLDRLAEGPVAPALVTSIDFGLPGRHLLLTFDDGGKSALAIGEELCRRGWRGHFFISTALIGRRTFLTADEIRQLHGCGHIIGSHSHNHPDIYRELPWEQMVVEWRRSTDILAQILGQPCSTAAVPGGEISSQVLRSAASAGLRYVFTSEPSLQPRIVQGAWILGRFCPKVSTTTEEMDALLRFKGWKKKLLVRRLKQLVSRSVPPLYRLYVGRSTREWQRSGA
jgi:peptidoglycan/xylan/chitin deacetylase (PgdA/CDA1 family)